MKIMIKRIMVVFISIILILSIFSITAFAGGDATVIYAPTVFNQIRSIEMANDGGFYVCDGSFDRIKKYTKDGILDTSFFSDGIFGSESGIHELNDVRSICEDSSRNLYIADSNNDRVLKYTSTGILDTTYSNDGIIDGFGNVYSIALDSAERLYVCDQMDNDITRYDANGNLDASFNLIVPDNNFPSSITIDDNDNLYVSVCFTTSGDPSMEVRKYHISNTSTYTSFGQGVGKQVNQPYGVYVDSLDRVYVADRANHRIFRFNSDATLDTSFNGSGILGGIQGSASSQFSSPIDLFVDEATGHLYIADSVNKRVKKYKLSDLTLDTSFDGDGILGDTRGTEPNQVYNINDIALCPDGGYVISDSGNDRIKKYTSSGALDTSFGNGGILTQLNGSAFENIYQVAMDNSGNIYVADSNADSIRICNSTGTFVRDITNAKIQSPKGVAVDSDNNIFVGDSGSDEIIKFNSTGSTVLWSRTVSDPYSIALDIDGTSIYVASAGSDNVQKYDTNGNLVSSFSGDGILEDGFSNPRGITVDGNGNIFVSDSTLDIVKKYQPNGILDTTFDSDGTYSRSRMDGDKFIDSPYGMMVKDNKLYIADRTNSRIVILGNISGISSEKAITSFKFESFDPDVVGTINDTDHTIAVTVPHDSDVTNLSPTIAISTNATISPLSGVSQNFTNPVEYTVTAEDTSQQIYTVTIDIAPDDDATLSDLTIDGTTIIGFDAADTDYDISVDHFTENIIIGATSTDVNANILGTGTFSFTGNTQTYTVAVTAEDGTTQESYDINVTRTPDDNATLSDITLDGTTISGFDTNDIEYDISVDHHTTSLTFGATPTDPNATVAGTGTFSFTGTTQTFTITATAEDGTTQKSYDINITRLPDDDATLFDIREDGGTIPGFDPNDTDYDLYVDHFTNTITLGATPNDTNATVTGTGTFSFTSNSQAFPLVVTAENGTTQKIYNVNIIRTPDNDAGLSDLTLDGNTIPGFDTNDTDYDVSVDHHATSITLGASTTDNNATLSGTGVLAFTGDLQTYTVIVTAEDGTTQKSYTINVTRSPDDDATLSDLTVDGNTVTGFNSNNTEYDVYLDHYATSFTIGAASTDSLATVSGTGTFPFTNDAVTKTVTITAEDGTTQHAYNVNIIRTPNNDATLCDLREDGATISGFDPNKLEYNIQVEHNVTSITIGAEPTQTNATVDGTGVFPFTSNNQSFLVTVTAEDGITKLIYKINITRTLNNDATLTKITIDGRPISSFIPNKTEYDVYVQNSANSVNIGATTNDSNATLIGAKNYSFTSNYKTCTITVTAENGITKKIYQVNIIRSKSNDASISSLKLNGDEVQGFSKNNLDYSITIDHATSNIKISSTTTNPNASVSGTGTFMLTNDQQTFELIVTAEDGTIKTYSLTVTRLQKEITPTPTPYVTPAPTPTPTLTPQNIIIASNDIAVDNTSNKVTVSINIADLPEGADAIKMPNGTIVKISDTTGDTIVVQLDEDNMNQDGYIELIIIDDDNIALGYVSIDVGDETNIINKTNNISKVLLILLGIVLIFLILLLLVKRRKKDNEDKIN